MARFLIVTWDGGGNVPPAFATAQALAEARHEVVIAGQELAERPDAVVAGGHTTLQERCEARGFPFTLLERSSAAWQTAPEPRIVGAMMACPQHLADVAAVLADKEPDVALVDCLMFGALAAMEDHYTRTAVLVHSAPGLLMAPGGEMERFVLGPVNELRERFGRNPVARLWDVWSAFPAICTTIPEFDPLAASAPPSFHYVGPAFDLAGSASAWQPPFAAEDHRPLVLVSFASTLAWDQRSRIERTLEALGGWPYRVLLTTSRTDLRDLSVPDNAAVLQHVPHHDVLPQVSVMVSHAGHGSVLTALAYGVPLVCLPNPVADQPGIAHQVEALGAGRALDGDNATAEEIATAVREVLGEPSYAVEARQLAALISRTTGAASAADRLAQLTR